MPRGLFWLCALAALAPRAAAAAEHGYVAAGATVRLHVGTEPPGWAVRGFDDRSWGEAQMPLCGQGRIEPAAACRDRLPAGAMILLARMRFHVAAEARRLRALVLRVRFGEGMVAYVDGREIARRYVSADAPADAPAREVHGLEWEEFVAPAPELLPGEHVLAIEVHGYRPSIGPLLDAELSGSDAVRIVRGPYLVRPGAGEVTVAWDTDLDAVGEIRYGPDARYGQVLASPHAVQHHALKLRGLESSRSYHYRVLAGEASAKLAGAAPASARGGSGADSGDLVFHTLPRSDEPLRFVFYGDTRSGHDVHARLVAQIAREDPDLLVVVGDLVDRGGEESEWQRFFQVAGPLLHSVPIAPALGNHDVAQGGLQRFFALFPPPPGAPEPGYYSFDASGVHFLMLDSNQLRSSRQLAFCDADLGKAAHARARFVAMHHGPWSMGFHGNNPDAIQRFVPVFARRGVTLVVSGHDHDYERGRQMGLDYLVSGGGGAPLYYTRCSVPKTCPPTTFALATEYHYVLVEVLRDSYRLCAKRLDGSALEPCVDLPVHAPRL
jgi:hypothetical protein